MDRRQRIEAVRKVVEQADQAPGAAAGAGATDDKEWEIAYARRLQAPLAKELGAELSCARLVALVMEAQDEHDAVKPKKAWPQWFAEWLVERYVAEPSETLALYYTPGCPFCRRVLATIDALGLQVELRNIWENHQWRHELMEARGRTTVPVLRCTAGEGKPRWMPESRDIVEFLKKRAKEPVAAGG